MTSKLYLAFLVTVISFTISGCKESPKDHFKDNQVGVSPDYGVFYDENLNGHVVTIHGFWDDHSVCMDIAEALKKKSNGKSYSCRKLN